MSASSIFDTALALAKADAIALAAPAVITFLQNISKGPLNGLTFITQVDLLRSSLTAALPNLAQTEVAQINQSFIGVIEQALAQAQATVTAATTAQAAVKPA
jgi:hypothetical protein